MELLIVAALLQLLVATFCVMRWSYWREKALAASAKYDDIMNRALEAEKDKAVAKDELARWQQMLASMQSRPIIAMLNDQQAAAFLTALEAFIRSNAHGAN